MVDGVPSGFRAWCAAHAVSPYHPRTWPPDVVADYRRWKRQLVVERWRWYRDHGFTRLLPRATLAMRVREDLDWIARDPPSKVWGSCPCHAQPRQQRDAPMTEAHGLAFIRRVGRRAGMTRQRRWQLDHIARGLCRLCSRPRHPQSTDSCWEHLLSRRLRPGGASA